MITVAICTWNRAELLQKTLQRLALTHAECGFEWELLVVNNNCTDNTSEVVERFRDVLPVRMILETKQGHSNARNRILSEANGEHIVWTDDDVLVKENWLASFQRAFKDYPEAAFFGGTVLPWLECDLPEWMARNWSEISGIYAITSNYSADFVLSRETIPVGANMACRTDIGRRFPFHPMLGRMKEELIGGDEVAWFREMIEAGHTGMWVSSAIVEHFIPKSRLTKEYLSQWFEKSGVAAARMQSDIHVSRIVGYPRWAILPYFTSAIIRRSFCFSKRSFWFRMFREECRLRGFLAESKKIHDEASIR
jgi:glycosyltransferase involved in cell wall biosynthesis